MTGSNHARWLAAESLAVEMAQQEHNKTHDTMIAPSERQTRLKIPLPLVVLAGLAHSLVGDSKEQPVESCFEQLQRVYRDELMASSSSNRNTETNLDGALTSNANCATRNFQWSPNLLPSSQAQQIQINTWIQERTEQLEREAATNARNIFEQETRNAAKKTRNKKKKTRNGRSQAKEKNNRSSEQDAFDDNDDSKSSASDSDRGGEGKTPSTLCLDSDENNQQPFGNSFGKARFTQMITPTNDSLDWTMVNRKSAKNTNVTLALKTDTVLPRRPTHISSPYADIANTADTLCSKGDGIYVLADGSPETSEKLLSSFENDSTMPSVESLQIISKPPLDTIAPSRESETESKAKLLRIQQLEAQLATANELLLQERQLHRKEMIREKEAAQERMQALQLRLYIAETRLKTFEDALAQHNLQVANNVAGPTSPGRRSSTESTRYSKVLRHQL